MKKLIKIVIIVLIIILVYYIGTKGLKVNEYVIVNNKIDSYSGLKIVHITDIHYEDLEENKLSLLVDEVNSLKPDIIVLTGDIASNYDEVLVEYLSKLEAFLGKYAVNGDIDNDFDKIIKDSGFINLNNAYDLIYYKSNNPIIISGIDNNMIDTSSFDSYNDYVYSILLMHQPDNLDKINVDNYDLILMGHANEFRLPFIGAIKKIDGARKYTELYYKINNTDIYISTGIKFIKSSFNFYRLRS